MDSNARVYADDLYETQEKDIAFVIESAAIGCEGKYLRAHPKGDIDSLIDPNQSFFGHDMLWIIETTSGGMMHLGRQFTIRNTEWPDKYLRVNCDGLGRHTLDCRDREEDSDGRTHFYFVRLRADSNALAIGSVGSPGVFIQMERDIVGKDGRSGIVDCRSGTGTSSWFYLTQVEL